MPRILHRALLKRLHCLPEVASFIADFRTLTGLNLRLLDKFGFPVSSDHPLGVLCGMVQRSPEGKRFCNRTRQRLLDRVKVDPAACSCDAGLNEVSIPLQISAQTVGFFVFEGFRYGPIGREEHRRLEHLLSKSGVNLSSAEHRRLLEASPVISREGVGAMTRLVALMTKHFGLLVLRQFGKEQKALPALAHRACRYIRAHGLTGSCCMKDVAHECGVSPAHLSRVFHHSTGLTLSEYLARVRVEHALGLLKNRRQPITEIAFASGFQSISQFNRTFKRIAGSAPTRFNPQAPSILVAVLGGLWTFLS